MSQKPKRVIVHVIMPKGLKEEGELLGFAYLHETWMKFFERQKIAVSPQHIISSYHQNGWEGTMYDTVNSCIEHYWVHQSVYVTRLSCRGRVMVQRVPVLEPVHYTQHGIRANSCVATGSANTHDTQVFLPFYRANSPQFRTGALSPGNQIDNGGIYRGSRNSDGAVSSGNRNSDGAVSLGNQNNDGAVSSGNQNDNGDHSSGNHDYDEAMDLSSESCVGASGRLSGMDERNRMEEHRNEMIRRLLEASIEQILGAVAEFNNIHRRPWLALMSNEMPNLANLVFNLVPSLPNPDPDLI